LSALSIGIGNGVLRMLQINDAGKIFQKETAFDFNPAVSASAKAIEDASQNLHEILSHTDELDFNDQLTAGILIGTDQTFLSVFPVDFSDEKTNIDSHILWELSNYFPGTYKNFNIRYYRLNNFSSGPVDEILLLAIDRKKIETLKTLFENAGIKIRNIEVDHFSVEKFLRENYSSEISNRRILNIGSRPGRIDFSILEKGNLKMYDFDTLEHLTVENSIIRQINNTQSLFGNIDNLFVYGDSNFERINEFLQVQFPEIKILQSVLPVDGHKFSPLYGLSLKNLALNN